MTSLAQIPAELLDRDKYHDFLNWVFHYPLGWIHTRATIQLWARAVHRPMRRSDWSAIETRWIHRNVKS